MKPERTTLTIAHSTPGAFWATRALRLGAWYVSDHGERGGLCVSHRSGIVLVGNLTPVRAARLLRALQQAPQCPVSDSELRDWADGGHPPSLEHPIFAWVAQLREIVGAVQPPPADPPGRVTPGHVAPGRANRGGQRRR